MDDKSFGKVYLVGVGPGDPELITLKARRCLEFADVVLYDNLVNEVLLAWAPLRAERIFVGKAVDRHTLLQEEIHQLLLELASRVGRVVRLKGGDPFVFGRGGEEAQYLRAQGIPFEVVPGVTAGFAAAAYAGIPVTHRRIARAVTLVTGHRQTTAQENGLDFQGADLDETVVVYMTVNNLRSVCENLMAAGRDPSTPAAVVEWATLPKQRTVTGFLENIADRCEAEGVVSPAVTIIGHVAALHETLSWFEKRPLFGKKVVVTRSREQAGHLSQRLRELGAEVFEFPTIQIMQPETPQPFDYVGTYDWVLLTSVNAVEMLFERLADLDQDVRDLKGVKLCVIGSGTANAVQQRGLRIDLVPEKYAPEHVVGGMKAREGNLNRKRVLLPRSDIARSALPAELRTQGAHVKELTAYRTALPEISQEWIDALVDFRPHLITFLSASTVQNFCLLLDGDHLDMIKDTAAVAAMGPVTRTAAEEYGFDVAVEPDNHNLSHLVEAICEWTACEAPFS